MDRNNIYYILTYPPVANALFTVLQERRSSRNVRRTPEKAEAGRKHVSWKNTPLVIPASDDHRRRERDENDVVLGGPLGNSGNGLLPSDEDSDGKFDNSASESAVLARVGMASAGGGARAQRHAVAAGAVASTFGSAAETQMGGAPRGVQTPGQNKPAGKGPASRILAERRQKGRV